MGAVLKRQGREKKFLPDPAFPGGRLPKKHKKEKGRSPDGGLSEPFSSCEK